jgi:hypothetical protein
VSSGDLRSWRCGHSRALDSSPTVADDNIWCFQGPGRKASHMVEGIRACLFDVFGTVVDWHTGVSRALAARASSRGVSGVDWLGVAID